MLYELTSKTIVNGNPKYPDLAPQLRDKLIIIPDMAPILKLHPNEKAAVWAQLRNLYDGHTGKCSGMGKRSDYRDLNISLIAASTPAIDNQILVHQDLGSRELLWRATQGEKVHDAVMRACWDNEKLEEEMRQELKDVTALFLSGISYNADFVVDSDVMGRIKAYASLLTVLRAPAEVDCFTGELLGNVCPEMPTRVLKQFKRIFIALKCLDVDYADSRALGVLRYLVLSSGFPVRVNLLRALLQARGEEGMHYFAKVLKVGVKTVYRELNVLWNLGLVNRRSVESDYAGQTRERFFWVVNRESEIVCKVEAFFTEEVEVSSLPIIIGECAVCGGLGDIGLLVVDGRCVCELCRNPPVKEEFVGFGVVV